MKKIRYSNFESINDVINQIGFKYDQPLEAKKEEFFNCWEELVGQKLAAVSKPLELDSKNVLLISCKNSFIANELFLSKKNLLSVIEEKAVEIGLEIKDIRFDYKNWKTN